MSSPLNPIPYRPVVLCILDGWGLRDDTSHNAIAAAETPNWDRLWAECPHSELEASELHVGLPGGQMGNSEVGHMNIGSGRIVMQDLPRIDQAIESGELAHHRKLQAMLEKVKASGGALHVLGLLSPGGVHAHQQHMAALANIAADAGVKVYVHAFLDGRDTPPQSALDYLRDFAKSIAPHPSIRIATVSGRYYAMDRDKRWDRVEKAYAAIVEGKGERAESPETAVKASYANGKNDEFVLPCVIGDYAGMLDGDAVLMANFRADRAREILMAMLDPSFGGFACRPPKLAAALGMVEYSTALNPFLETLFPPETLKNILGEVVARNGLKQLRIAETEKYAHVTFFFNGGEETPFTGEERILVPSPNVATYDLQPEMSAPEVTEKLVAAINAGTYDVIVVNYANTDMVGHTGDMNAAIQAVEAVDASVGRLAEAVQRAGGVLLMTADHGNAEMMHNDETAAAHTAHTLNPVPFVVMGANVASLHNGRLCDIAPTILDLMRISKPDEMTGRSLLVRA